MHITHMPETQALTDFREHTATVLKRLAKSGKPLLLTQKGKAAGVVMSTKVYEQLADAAALAESITAVRQSLEEFAQGKSRPADVVLDRLDAKYRAMLGRKKR